MNTHQLRRSGPRAEVTTSGRPVANPRASSTQRWTDKARDGPVAYRVASGGGHGASQRIRADIPGVTIWSKMVP